MEATLNLSIFFVFFLFSPPTSLRGKKYLPVYMLKAINSVEGARNYEFIHLNANFLNH